MQPPFHQPLQAKGQPSDDVMLHVTNHPGMSSPAKAPQYNHRDIRASSHGMSSEGMTSSTTSSIHLDPSHGTKFSSLPPEMKTPPRMPVNFAAIHGPNSSVSSPYLAKYGSPVKNIIMSDSAKKIIHTSPSRQKPVEAGNDYLASFRDPTFAKQHHNMDVYEGQITPIKQHNRMDVYERQITPVKQHNHVDIYEGQITPGNQRKRLDFDSKSVTSQHVVSGSAHVPVTKPLFVNVPPGPLSCPPSSPLARVATSTRKGEPDSPVRKTVFFEFDDNIDEKQFGQIVRRMREAAERHSEEGRETIPPFKLQDPPRSKIKRALSSDSDNVSSNCSSKTASPIKPKVYEANCDLSQSQSHLSAAGSYSKNHIMHTTPDSKNQIIHDISDPRKQGIVGQSHSQTRIAYGTPFVASERSNVQTHEYNVSDLKPSNDASSLKTSSANNLSPRYVSASSSRRHSAGKSKRSRDQAHDLQVLQEKNIPNESWSSMHAGIPCSADTFPASSNGKRDSVPIILNDSRMATSINIPRADGRPVSNTECRHLPREKESSQASIKYTRPKEGTIPSCKETIIHGRGNSREEEPVFVFPESRVASSRGCDEVDGSEMLMDCDDHHGYNHQWEPTNSSFLTSTNNSHSITHHMRDRDRDHHRTQDRIIPQRQHFQNSNNMFDNYEHQNMNASSSSPSSDAFHNTSAWNPHRDHRESDNYHGHSSQRLLSSQTSNYPTPTPARTVESHITTGHSNIFGMIRHGTHNMDTRSEHHEPHYYSHPFHTTDTASLTRQREDFTGRFSSDFRGVSGEETTRVPFKTDSRGRVVVQPERVEDMSTDMIRLLGSDEDSPNGPSRQHFKEKDFNNNHGNDTTDGCHVVNTRADTNVCFISPHELSNNSSSSSMSCGESDNSNSSLPYGDCGPGDRYSRSYRGYFDETDGGSGSVCKDVPSTIPTTNISGSMDAMVSLSKAVSSDALTLASHTPKSSNGHSLESLLSIQSHTSKPITKPVDLNNSPVNIQHLRKSPSVLSPRVCFSKNLSYSDQTLATGTATSPNIERIETFENLSALQPKLLVENKRYIRKPHREKRAGYIRNKAQKRNQNRERDGYDAKSWSSSLPRRFTSGAYQTPTIRHRSSHSMDDLLQEGSFHQNEFESDDDGLDEVDGLVDNTGKSASTRSLDKSRSQEVGNKTPTNDLPDVVHCFDDHPVDAKDSGNDIVSCFDEEPDTNTLVNISRDGRSAPTPVHNTVIHCFGQESDTHQQKDVVRCTGDETDGGPRLEKLNQHLSTQDDMKTRSNSFTLDTALRPRWLNKDKEITTIVQNPYQEYPSHVKARQTSNPTIRTELHQTHGGTIMQTPGSKHENIQLSSVPNCDRDGSKDAMLVEGARDRESMYSSPRRGNIAAPKITVTEAQPTSKHAFTTGHFGEQQRQASKSLPEIAHATNIFTGGAGKERSQTKVPKLHRPWLQSPPKPYYDNHVSSDAALGRDRVHSVGSKMHLKNPIFHGIAKDKEVVDFYMSHDEISTLKETRAQNVSNDVRIGHLSTGPKWKKATFPGQSSPMDGGMTSIDSAFTSQNKIGTSTKPPSVMSKHEVKWDNRRLDGGHYQPSSGPSPYDAALLKSSKAKSTGLSTGLSGNQMHHHINESSSLYSSTSDRSLAQAPTLSDASGYNSPSGAGKMLSRKSNTMTSSASSSNKPYHVYPGELKRINAGVENYKRLSKGTAASRGGVIKSTKRGAVTKLDFGQSSALLQPSSSSQIKATSPHPHPRQELSRILENIGGQKDKQQVRPPDADNTISARKAPTSAIGDIAQRDHQRVGGVVADTVNQSPNVATRRVPERQKDEIDVRIQVTDVMAQTRNLGQRLEEIYNSANLDCECARVEQEVLKTALDVFGKLCAAPETQANFTQELQKTNTVIADALEVANSLRQLCRHGRRISDVISGSVILRIKCKTLMALQDLCHMQKSGELQSLLFVILRMRNLNLLPGLTIRVTISARNIKTCLSFIRGQIKTLMKPVAPTSRTPKKSPTKRVARSTENLLSSPSSPISPRSVHERWSSTPVLPTKSPLMSPMHPNSPALPAQRRERKFSFGEFARSAFQELNITDTDSPPSSIKEDHMFRPETMMKRLFAPMHMTSPGRPSPPPTSPLTSPMRLKRYAIIQEQENIFHHYGDDGYF